MKGINVFYEMIGEGKVRVVMELDLSDMKKETIEVKESVPTPVDNVCTSCQEPCQEDPEKEKQEQILKEKLFNIMAMVDQLRKEEV